MTTGTTFSNEQLAGIASDITSALGIDTTASFQAQEQQVTSVLQSIQQIRQGGAANVIEGTSSIGAILLGDHSPILQVLKQIASGAGDASAIAKGVKGVLFGWQEGEILEGAEAGSSASSAATAIDTLLNELSANGSGGALSTGQEDTAGITGAIVAIFTALFGNHDNPANMPDKYDTARFGQEVADLQGVAIPVGETFKESSDLSKLFDGRTGIQAVEETLAEYPDATSAPDWLKPQYDQLEALFGTSATGAGVLSFGHAINNEQIIDVPGTDGGVHQYTDLANALYEFADAYAAANTVGIYVPQSS